MLFSSALVGLLVSRITQ